MRIHAGFGLVELLAVVAIVSIAAMVATPSVVRLQRSAIGRAGAREVVTELHSLRWRAAATGQAHGMWFREQTRGWSWQTVVDGNGNGLSTNELRHGIDRVLDWASPARGQDRGALRLPGGHRLPGDPALVGAHRRGRSDTDRPQRCLGLFPTGSSTSGSLYVTDGGAGLFGVVLYGATGRVRVLRYDASSDRWRL